ncbi:MAG: hypothetical protein DRN96_05640 [Thermoproteota archaeon]|nr:MAG: hypothetical protein DRN96_05640 [Candidatus Korarchaeota archaeon]
MPSVPEPAEAEIYVRSYARALEQLGLNMSFELSMVDEAAEKARESEALAKAGAREEADLKLKASRGLLNTARTSVDLKLDGLKLSSAFTIGLLAFLSASLACIAGSKEAAPLIFLAAFSYLSALGSSVALASAWFFSRAFRLSSWTLSELGWLASAIFFSVASLLACEVMSRSFSFRFCSYQLRARGAQSASTVVSVTLVVASMLALVSVQSTYGTTGALAGRTSCADSIAVEWSRVYFSPELIERYVAPRYQGRYYVSSYEVGAEKIARITLNGAELNAVIVLCTDPQALDVLFRLEEFLSAGRLPEWGEKAILLTDSYAEYIGAKLGDEVNLTVYRVGGPRARTSLVKYVSIRGELIGLLDHKKAMRELRDATGARLQPSIKALVVYSTRYPKPLRGARRVHYVIPEDEESFTRAPKLVEEYSIGGAAGWYVGYHVWVNRNGLSVRYSKEYTPTLLGGEAAKASVIPASICVLLVLQAFLSELERRREEIKVYSIVGMPPSAVRGAFLAQGAVLGAIGSSAGAGLGTLLSKLAGLGGYVSPLWLTVAVSAGVVLAMVGSVIPASRAATLTTPSLERKWRLQEQAASAEDRIVSVLPVKLRPQDEEAFLAHVRRSIEESSKMSGFVLQRPKHISGEVSLGEFRGYQFEALYTSEMGTFGSVFKARVYLLKHEGETKVVMSVIIPPFATGSMRVLKRNAEEVIRRIRELLLKWVEEVGG